VIIFSFPFPSGLIKYRCLIRVYSRCSAHKLIERGRSAEERSHSPAARALPPLLPDPSCLLAVTTSRLLQSPQPAAAA